MINLSNIKNILDVTSDIAGKIILIRCDYNVPIEKNASGELVIVDDFRIRQTLPTLTTLRQAGARLILLAHLESDMTDSLSLIASRLSQLLGTPLPLITGYISEEKKSINDQIAKLSNGDIVLFENLRTYPGEKKNDAWFASELASYGDIYVNDAFSVSHRNHASVSALPHVFRTQNKPVYAGPLFLNEIKNISKAFTPEHPFLFIVGGAKFETKLGLIQKFLSTAECVFVGGALANDVLKARGFPVGKSLVSQGVSLADIINHPHLIVPVDVLVQDFVIKNPQDVGPDDIILDVGPRTVDLLIEKVKTSRYVVWNGPLGKYQDGFKESTERLGKAIADQTAHVSSTTSCESLIGGGDTLAVVAQNDLQRMSFVSTGGGAMLDFLANETLPGIEALL